MSNVNNTPYLEGTWDSARTLPRRRVASKTIWPVCSPTTSRRMSLPLFVRIAGSPRSAMRTALALAVFSPDTVAAKATPLVGDAARNGRTSAPPAQQHGQGPHFWRHRRPQLLQELFRKNGADNLVLYGRSSMTAGIFSVHCVSLPGLSRPLRGHTWTASTHSACLRSNRGDGTSFLEGFSAIGMSRRVRGALA